MDLSLVQNFFNFMSNNIFAIIYVFAAVEIYLIIAIYYMMKKHEMVLADVSTNLIKGFKDAPDYDSTQNIHEKIQTTLDFINQKITTDQNLKTEFSKNANTISQRPFYSRHYKIEIFASVISTLVQVFPLLGILGTILAIAQTAMGKGAIDVSSLSSAFVLAMDTTILGITFSIIFMVIESTFGPKIERIITESLNFKQIVTKINMTE
ncbi:MotA/TolQ/ExbB proton channel family protein [Halobacteriovorax sp. JY17]|uniref:MotA/TolQ/ExbB proton channel family protein n=1 Tax=Halobacteriovorax sp. JY17 TaxID=2014617 RepID=UPI000C604064|nr:MotA/TolQ/ExbB proton channel family protein [Halobacteriovorax sp. JY17]PIK15736.1 MAG: hypothetical protein CES88_03130 [Halobacteriovorax sp. JY17]